MEIVLQEMFTKGKESAIIPLSVSIGQGSTTLLVEDGSALSDAPNTATIFDRFGSVIETIRYSEKTGNTLTGVTRGIGGTTARSWVPRTDSHGNAVINLTNAVTSFEHDATVANLHTLLKISQELQDQIDKIEVGDANLQPVLDDISNIQKEIEDLWTTINDFGGVDMSGFVVNSQLDALRDELQEKIDTVIALIGDGGGVDLSVILADIADMQDKLALIPGNVDSAIDTHDTSAESHSDIRMAISDLSDSGGGAAYIPNYTKISAPVIVENNGEWVAEQDGFIQVESGANSIDSGWIRLNVWIAGERILWDSASSAQNTGNLIRISGLFPVGAGDPVKLEAHYAEGRIENPYVVARFVPPRNIVLGTGERGEPGVQGERGEPGDSTTLDLDNPDFVINNIWDVTNILNNPEMQPGRYVVRGSATYPISSTSPLNIPNLRNRSGILDISTLSLEMGVVCVKLTIPTAYFGAEWILMFWAEEADWDEEWNATAWAWSLGGEFPVGVINQTFQPNRSGNFGMYPVTINNNVVGFVDTQSVARGTIRTILTSANAAGHITDFNTGNAILPGTHQLNATAVIANSPPSLLTGSLIRNADVKQLPSSMIDQDVSLRRSAAPPTSERWTRTRTAAPVTSFLDWQPTTEALVGTGTAFSGTLATGGSDGWNVRRIGNQCTLTFNRTHAAGTLAAGTVMMVLPVGMRPTVATSFVFQTSASQNVFGRVETNGNVVATSATASSTWTAVSVSYSLV